MPSALPKIAFAPLIIISFAIEKKNSIDFFFSLYRKVANMSLRENVFHVLLKN
jgi:ABC-type nitrate/sulfonate/bicarbonate transport system permease component